MNLVINMSEPEIKAAIRAAVNATGLVSVGQEVEVNLVAGRGPNGHSAIIDIKQDLNGPAAEFLEQEKTEVEPAPKKDPPKAETKTTPKAEPAPETPVETAAKPEQEQPAEPETVPESVTDLFSGDDAAGNDASEVDPNNLPEGEEQQAEEPESLFA